MADGRYRSGRRYPDADVVQEVTTRRYLFDLIDALNDRDKNEVEFPINKNPYPTTVSTGNVDVVVSVLLVDLRKAGIIK